jgi:hypothetical protein
MTSSLRSARFIALSSVVLCVGIAPAQQEVTQLDVQNVYRTHVRTRNSSQGGGGNLGTSPSSYNAVRAAFGGTPYTVGATVSPTTTTPEAEEHIAVNKNFPNFLFSMISDFSLPGGVNTSKYSYSSNNGLTWTQSFVPLDGSNMRITADGLAWPYNSDPVVCIANDGTIYATNLYFGNGNDGGLYVSHSSVASPGLTAANTIGVQVHPDPNSTVFEDKQWIAVDNSNSAFAGTVYVSWTRFDSSNRIMLSKSSNGGVTWSAPIQVSDAAFNGAVQGSQVAVGPDGAVYVAYHVAYVGNKGIQWVHKSTNGGASFGARFQATPQYNEPTFSSQYRKNSFCQMVINPVSGYISMCYPDQPKGQTGAEVRFVRSTSPGGTTFTSPISVNNVTTGNQFFPAIAVDELGHLHMRWIDTRNTGVNNSLDCYASRSTDNGTTWSPNSRLSATSWSVGTSTFIGDYGGVCAAAGYAHPVWTTGLAPGGTGGLKTCILQ